MYQCAHVERVLQYVLACICVESSGFGMVCWRLMRPRLSAPRLHLKPLSASRPNVSSSSLIVTINNFEIRIIYCFGFSNHYCTVKRPPLVQAVPFTPHTMVDHLPTAMFNETDRLRPAPTGPDRLRTGWHDVCGLQDVCGFREVGPCPMIFPPIVVCPAGWTIIYLPPGSRSGGRTPFGIHWHMRHHSAPTGPYDVSMYPFGFCPDP